MSQMVDVTKTGSWFEMTPEQVAAIAPASAELVAANEAGDQAGMLLAQIWGLEDGRTVATVVFIPSDRAAILLAVVHADAVTLERVVEDPPTGLG